MLFPYSIKRSALVTALSLSRDLFSSTVQTQCTIFGACHVNAIIMHIICLPTLQQRVQSHQCLLEIKTNFLAQVCSWQYELYVVSMHAISVPYACQNSKKTFNDHCLPIHVKVRVMHE